MNSQVLFTLGLALTIISIGLLIYALQIMRKIRSTRKILTGSEDESNIEQVFTAIGVKIKKLETSSNAFEQEIQALKNFTKTTIHKIGMQKYNALEGEGGNLSFSLALLDQNNSGVVISSMNGRNQNRIYAKQIKEGHASISLTSEENQAMANANNIPSKE